MPIEYITLKWGLKRLEGTGARDKRDGGKARKFYCPAIASRDTARRSKESTQSTEKHVRLKKRDGHLKFCWDRLEKTARVP